jgi:hypothetical protein
MTTHAMTIIVQDKARFLTERTSKDDSLPLTIETYGCFNPHFDSFLTSYIHTYITHHRQTSLVLYFITCNECR